MSIEALPQRVLGSIGILHEMDDDERRQLLDVAQRVAFDSGDVILRQGQCSQNLWIVLKGRCDVLMQPPDHQDGQAPIVLAVLEPYDSFGEMSFFDAAPHSASVRAQTHVELLRISRPQYDALMENGSRAACKLARNVIQSLAERLRRMDEWVCKLHGDDPVRAPVPEWDRLRNKLFDGWKL